MKVFAPLLMFLSIILGLILNMFSSVIPGAPTSTVTDPPPTSTPLPTATIPPLTSTPSPTEIATEFPTPTLILVQVNATVWTEEPAVPILTLHQFKPDGISPSDFNGHKLQISDFRDALQDLYDNGYSLVSLEDWMTGDMVVADGRRPLVFTMDDLFFRNQICLDENGSPNPDTGIGAIWQFYQEHPAFDFHMSLFAVLGDKYYPSDPSTDPQWELKLAQTIVWCIEHDALVYNHTYRHGCLDKISITEFIDQLSRNNAYLRQLLFKAGRKDLIPGLRNMVALPGGIAPKTSNDWGKLQDYQNPEGEPIQAILQIYSVLTNPITWEYLTRPYDPGFDRYQIIRIAANMENMQFLVENCENFPTAKSCTLSLEEGRQKDDAYLSEQIQTTIESGVCPVGLYVLDGKLFDSRSYPVIRISMP